MGDLVCATSLPPLLLLLWENETLQLTGERKSSLSQKCFKLTFNVPSCGIRIFKIYLFALHVCDPDVVLGSWMIMCSCVYMCVF